MVKCVMGVENRAMIRSIKEEVIGIHNRFDRFEEKMDKRLTELYNHMSSRLPIWATILFTILGSAVVGLAVAFLR